MALKTGSYRSVITPPLGICMEGGFDLVRAENVLDDLFANALVLDDGQTEVALVSVDVGSIETGVYHQIAFLAAQMTGIREENILVTATHTHSGPATWMTIEGVYEVDPIYVEFFIRQTASAIRLAQLRKQAVQVSAAKGENRDFVFNRRLQKPDGMVVMNWVDKGITKDYWGNGKVNPELVSFKFADETGKPLALIVNYWNHDNAQSRPAISADYSGVMTRHLRAVYGDQLVVLFLPGPAGDINWINYRDLNQWSSNLYQKIGRSLAGTVLEMDARCKPLDVNQIEITQRRMMIPERPYREYDIVVDDTFGIPEHNRDFFDAYRSAYEKYKDLPLPIHEVNTAVLKLGDQAVIATNPAELFVEFGLQILSQTPFSYTMVAELTNGLIGYVATPEAFTHGGYEVRKVPGGSFMAVETGDQIVSAWKEMLVKK